MRIACIGDIHLIDPDGPDHDLIADRSFFIGGQASLLQLFETLADHNIDMVIFLGDLVDWVCEANIALAHKILGQLSVPWKCVPGNHDFAQPNFSQPTFSQPAFSQPATAPNRNCRALWLDKDIDMSTQYIDCEEFGLVLLDNALGYVDDSDLHSFDAMLDAKKYNIVCQHVPLALPGIRSAIHAAAPSRDLNNYTCNSPCDLYQRYYHGRVQAVVSGHVHIDTIALDIDGCTHHLCNLGISISDPNRNEKSIASANIIEFVNGAFRSEIISLS